MIAEYINCTVTLCNAIGQLMELQRLNAGDQEKTETLQECIDDLKDIVTDLREMRRTVEATSDESIRS